MDCIPNTCDKIDFFLTQGRGYGTCWFVSSLNALLLGQYSRIFLFNLLKEYAKTHKIELIDDDSCPLFNEKSLMEIIYKIIYLNYGINPDYLNDIRLNEKIVNKNELWNPIRKVLQNEFIKQDRKIPTFLNIKTGGKPKNALQMIFKKLNINYDYVEIPIYNEKGKIKGKKFKHLNILDIQSFNLNYAKINEIFINYEYAINKKGNEITKYHTDYKFENPFILIDVYDICKFYLKYKYYDLEYFRIPYEININENKYFLNSIFLSSKKGDNGHTTCIGICNGNLFHYNSWSSSKIVKVNIPLKELNFMNICSYKYGKRLYEYDYTTISLLMYVKENNLACKPSNSFGNSILEYLNSL
jgi:hypothetical protein